MQRVDPILLIKSTNVLHPCDMVFFLRMVQFSEKPDKDILVRGAD